jgi:hypothetical protein
MLALHARVTVGSRDARGGFEGLQAVLGWAWQRGRDIPVRRCNRMHEATGRDRANPPGGGISARAGVVRSPQRTSSGELIYPAARSNIRCSTSAAMSHVSHASNGKPVGPFHSSGGSEQIAPPCPFCDSADTVVIGHDGAHGAITLCRCNACRTSGPKQFQTNPIRWSRHRVPLS